MAVRRKNNDFKEVSCSSSKKAKTSCDEKKDFFCDLPDDVLVHILSFLPIKDAISTVFLRRFGNLWRRIRVLDFDQCVYPYFDKLEPDQDEHCLNFRKFIRHLVNFHESGTLDKLCFKFNFFVTCLVDGRHYDDNEDAEAWKKGLRDHLNMLIRYALSKQVKVLEFDLRDENEYIYDNDIFFPNEFYDLPDVLNSNYLTHLKLSAVNIMLCKTTNLKSLKVLSLDNVTLSDEVMEKTLVGCPLLEHLSLIDCYSLRNLICENSKNLKKVTIALNGEESDPLIVSCPHVLSLEINGWLQRAWLHQSSVDVSISYSQFSCVRNHKGVCLFLKKVNACNTFRPCSWTILLFTIWNFTNVPCPSFECKNLILNLDMIKWHHPGLCLLLRNCQSLKTLTINIFPTNLTAKMFFERAVQAEWIEAYEFDMDNFWGSQEAASFPSLKIITINGHVNEPYVNEIVRFLVRSATSLQKLEIYPQTLSTLTHAQESYYLA